VNNGKLLIADLGLSKKLVEITSHSMANNMGMVEYDDPQFYKVVNYKKNKKTDIYCLGILLWEISSGRPPFPGYPQKTLGFHIYNGLREKPIEGTPTKYQQLYEECWDSEPNSRPDIGEVYETLSRLKTEDSLETRSPRLIINEQDEPRKSNSEVDYSDIILSISGSKFNFINNYMFGCKVMFVGGVRIG